MWSGLRVENGLLPCAALTDIETLQTFTLCAANPSRIRLPMATSEEEPAQFEDNSGNLHTARSKPVASRQAHDLKVVGSNPTQDLNLFLVCRNLFLVHRNVFPGFDQP